jgi:hypothetical protein
MSSSDDWFINFAKNLEGNITIATLFLIIIPGLILNILNILIFSRKAFPTNVRSLHISLAIIDFGNLAMFNFSFLPRPFNIASTTDFTCKITFVFIMLFFQSVNWQHVVISFDRLFSIFYSAKYKSIIGTKYLCCLLCCTIGIASSTIPLNVHGFRFETNVTENNQTTLQRMCQMPTQLIPLINLSSMVLRLVIPNLLIFTSTITLVYKLFWKKKKMKKLSKNDYNFAFALLAMNLFFLLFNLPYQIARIYEATQTQIGTFHRFLLSLLTRSTVFLNYMNSAYTFFVYLRFNFLFRKEVSEIVKNNFIGSSNG